MNMDIIKKFLGGFNEPDNDVKLAKAVLCVMDLNSKNNTNVSTGLNNSVAAAAAMALESAYRQAKQTDSQGQLSGKIKDRGYKAFEVQFNPVEIGFDVQAQLPDSKENGNVGADVYIVSKSVKNVMTLPLIFDVSDTTSAFIWSKRDALVNGSLTDKIKASSVAEAVTDTLGSNGIQKQIDGLLSLISNSVTRNVVFIWGDMSISGMITGEEIKYEMFDTMGNPVRGRVTLSITVYHGIEDSDNAKYMNKAFDRLFEKKQDVLTDDVENTMRMAGELMAYRR